METSDAASDFRFQIFQYKSCTNICRRGGQTFQKTLWMRFSAGKISLKMLLKWVSIHLFQITVATQSHGFGYNFWKVCQTISSHFKTVWKKLLPQLFSCLYPTVQGGYASNHWSYLERVHSIPLVELSNSIISIYYCAWVVWSMSHYIKSLMWPRRMSHYIKILS